MTVEPPAMSRELRRVPLSCDLAVIGGGLAGVCCSVTAARAGLRVVLVQDRPVLGGNASSEVRLWILGATSHMGNNNRWAREGGVIDEILVENMFRNPEGNPLVVDTILLEWVTREPNITLLLNTAAHDVGKSDAANIRSVSAFCSQNSTAYDISAPLFCDASGDGIVGFLAGAAFRMGAEARGEFGELFAPEEAEPGMLGHTMYFYSKDTGRPVRFVPPAFALSDITRVPRWRDFKAGDSGCRLWWIEWGGTMDTIHDSETIKWELWKVVYGVWDHIKNSGRFPEAETLTLEWVGTIPGKRESRRFEGDHILTQRDVVEQRTHPDAVSFGGWAIDLHPPMGVYSPLPPCTQWHGKGVYQIPFRCLYSRNIDNLFLAGRIISASHVAFASTRVMATCAHGAQAVGMAAALCHRDGLLPRDLLEPARMADLQRRLSRVGQHIPGVPLHDPDDLARRARLSASSQLSLSSFLPSGEVMELTESWAMMLPMFGGPVPRIDLLLDVAAETTLEVELRVSSRAGNHTPDVVLERIAIPLRAGGGQWIGLPFSSTLDSQCYAFVCVLLNGQVAVHLSDQLATGVLALCHNGNKAVTKSATQSPPPGIGVDSFEFWTPKRRPHGKNLALRINPPLQAFGPENLVNGYNRPAVWPNAWVADFAHEQPVVRMRWDDPQEIARIELDMDTDFDHPMESVLMGHPERVMPYCVSHIRVAAVVEDERAGDPDYLSGSGSRTVTRDATELAVLAEISGNHQSRVVIGLGAPVVTRRLEIHVVAPSVNVPASLFAVRCYGPGK
ncbi:MAG: FAD-dependent oxidoreductase [Verrucomicrobia bacterium]|nr:FAD-dependent oxidoreductase [Verrucomicrobiota bacterium]